MIDNLDLFSDGFELELLEKFFLDDDKERGLTNISSSVFKIIKINDIM